MKTMSFFAFVPLIVVPVIAADIESAAELGLKRVQQAAVNWQSNDDCFSCHHHTLPILAAIEGSRAGLALDSEWLKLQTDLTLGYFLQRIDDMNAGKHVPGGAASVGYGLWALKLAEHPPDETTTAMVNYLLKIQGVVRLKEGKPSKLTELDDGRWIASCRRAPMQASVIGDTVLSLMGIHHYATDKQQPRAKKAKLGAEKWLASAKLLNQQDRLWRLWGLHHLHADEDAKRSLQADILNTQQDDGGWGETIDRPSEPFSTGQTIYMLCRTGTSPADPALVRGCAFLMNSQYPDGSWLFESHVKPVQPFFDNGDPHGKNQFISVAATAWATSALLQVVPKRD